MSTITTHPALADGARMERDSNDVCRASFDRLTRSHLRKIVDIVVIEEHRRKPSGRHSEALSRLLAYFRRLPADRQYLLRTVSGGYRIIKMAAKRNAVGPFVGEDIYATAEAGYHAIFMLKLKDMMDEDDG